MSEKLNLQWNDFQENVKSAFGNMREDQDFSDVTLACEDGQQVEAHKGDLGSVKSILPEGSWQKQAPPPTYIHEGDKVCRHCGHN